MCSQVMVKNLILINTIIYLILYKIKENYFLKLLFRELEVNVSIFKVRLKKYKIVTTIYSIKSKKIRENHFK